jgi:hypothetical protein
MSIIIFSGPTITKQEGLKVIKADFRPPAKQGDVYAAALEKPKAILIIDGVFESQPAVWHKEILFAMFSGIHVYGSSSMGALRAAELAPFGMVGLGKVFSDYNNATLEDDDEVALIHGPSEMNFLAISEPMVNIRETLGYAESKGVITSKECWRLIEYSKNLWYPERNYRSIKQFINNEMLLENPGEVCEFIDNHSVNIKKEDAIAALNHLSTHSHAIFSTPKKVDFNFEITDSWLALVSQVNESREMLSNHISYDALKLELKIQGKYFDLKERAITRCLMTKKMKEDGFVVTEVTRNRALIELARKQKCVTPSSIDFDQLSVWMRNQQVSADEFDSLVSVQASMQWLDDMDIDISHEMVELLKLDGEFQKYQSLINNKSALASDPIDSVSDETLWSWFFSERIAMDMPKDIDRYAIYSGFENAKQLREVVKSEYWFWQAQL